ncbi:hypothetical protein GZ77_00380 [Endozoicomonas montiporae]|uniref:Uncharacterized protein n=2 Tax=Endozoicomonas montiporae TaxID=1027273 RepID=A0A081N9S0_9GAMM|nr:TauD/TfdA family dioxygenase [Endozoicomonas montiporae]AMO55049.1 hypothetical protein EZMO1_0824 [Endozoicomonas montiporae CL-33]KEQ15193.1 hypothetical protein GZ77_00380 [Endozoicomonas montiporae]
MSSESPVITCNYADYSVPETVSQLKNNQLTLINNINFEQATRLVLELTDTLGLSTDSEHHFNNLGDPFRVPVNEVFYEVSKYGGHSIFFHNENAYSQNSPEVTCFYCQSNSEFGGENLYLRNDLISKARAAARMVLKDIYAKKVLNFNSMAEINQKMAALPNFIHRKLTSLQDYIEHLGQYTHLQSVELSDTRLEVTHQAGFVKTSCLDGEEYLQVPSDGTCQVSFHLPEFCERKAIFYNPMFRYLSDHEDAFHSLSSVQYFSDKHCTHPIDLNKILFEMVLIIAYTDAIPVKLSSHNLIIFNNKSWMHSVNAPGMNREMYVSYAYQKP